ncbi:transposase [Limosilactobacillus fermentum]|uniref:transposase n=1 Tax=Limosilactobacillus fermentum TaxID=1613 RepID=UPI002091DB69|nr:transposase [Limosilactobacillus fermentum]UVF14338.1 transposase [Limosilactobacillus fermentum]
MPQFASYLSSFQTDPSTLHKWIKLFTETGEFGRGSGNFASDKDKEIARLKRQLRDAEGAIEVLKKSIGILSK